MAQADESLSGRIKEAMIARWDDLRERSVFYQARVFIVILYAVVVLATVFIAPPRVADVEFQWDKVSFGASFISYVEIQNNDLGTLKDVTVEVRGEGVEFDGRKKAGVWSGTIRTLKEDERLRIKPNMLTDKGGIRAPNEINISFITLRDKDGDVVGKGSPKRKKAK